MCFALGLKTYTKLSNAKSIIKHSYSHNFNCLQIVDFISWAIFQKFEYENDEFVNKLSSKLEIHQIWK